MNKKKKQTILIVMIIVLLLVLIGIGIWIGVSLNRTSGEPNSNPGGIQLDPNQGAYNPDSNSGTSSQGVAIPGWGKITIPVNETEVTVDFYNPEQNKDLYYLTFELRLPDSNGGYEVLYKSGLVEAGNHVQNITLSRGLDEGTYEAIIFVQPYRMDGVTPTNNAETQTELIVK